MMNMKEELRIKKNEELRSISDNINNIYTKCTHLLATTCILGIIIIDTIKIKDQYT